MCGCCINQSSALKLEVSHLEIQITAASKGPSSWEKGSLTFLTWLKEDLAWNVCPRYLRFYNSHQSLVRTRQDDGHCLAQRTKS